MIDFAFKARGSRFARRVYPFARAAGGALVVALVANACSVNDILKVNDPDVATPASTQSATALSTVLNGAIGDFHEAYGGDGGGNESSGEIGYGGLLSDEIRSSDTFPTRTEIDERHIELTNGNVAAQFRLLQRARASADRSLDRFAAFGPDSAGHSLAFSLSGLSTVMLAENWCSGSPISKLNDDGTLTLGDQLTTTQLLQLAQAKFDSGLAIPSASDDELNLAAVGKGRALLDQSDFAGAAAAVASVPDDFVFFDESSATATNENNGLWSFFQNVRRLSVAGNEGGTGLNYNSANDPRVPVDSTGKHGFDATTPLVLQELYPDRTSPIPIATGAEARLIEAEAALQAGDDATLLAKLNQARQDAMAVVKTETAPFASTIPVTLDTTIAPIPSDSIVGASQTQKENMLFRERAFDLFLTSHRLGDMRRLLSPPYNRDQSTVFAVGSYFKDGSPIGTDVSLPVPAIEANNPNFKGCLDTTH